jgi:dGTPase
MTSKARRVITQLFDAFLADEKLLPPEHRAPVGAGEKKAVSEATRARAVADYIAGMTDRYAILEHRRLFEAGERT